MMSQSFVPNKVLSISIDDVQFRDFWPYNDAEDPWWSGGSNPQPYTWEITISVAELSHSGNRTREEFLYNGLDIYTDDWIALNNTSDAFLITKVISKTESSAVLLVEDKFRYNTFKDSSSRGNGAPRTGPGVIFELSEEGMPIFDPLPNTLTNAAFVGNVESRFRIYNTSRRLEFFQENNMFEVGDIIAVVEDSGFELVNSTNAITTVGRVVEAGPGPSLFSVTTDNKVIKSTQRDLPGKPGTFLYSDDTNPGRLSDVKNDIPLYLRLTDPAPCITVSNKVPTVNAGDVLKINGVDVTFTGVSISTIISDINLFSDQHGVTASSINLPTTVTGALSDTAFGGVFCGVNPPGSAEINGVTVIFDNDTASPGSYGNSVDVANNINNAGITNLTASESNGVVSLTQLQGGSISITNITNESFGSPIAGTKAEIGAGGSATGLPLFTPANTTETILLTQPDGLSIILANVSGNPLEGLGLISTDNGKLPLLMNVEGGLREASTTVVLNIPSRDALSPSVGDQAMVLDSDDGAGNKAGEWSMWLWDGSAWIKTSDQDSAATDANSAEITITPATGAETLIYRVSSTTRVTLTTVVVGTAFDGAPTISIGDDTVPDRLMSDNVIDLGTQGTYASTSDYMYTVNDADIKVYFNAGGATIGNAKIIISYQ